MAEITREAVEEYVERHTTPYPAQMRELFAEAAATLPFPAMLSGPVVGRLLETLVWATGARQVLEIGTYAGYSTLAMAGALAPGGRVVTCEIGEEQAEFARRAFEASEYGDRIDLHVGPALETIASLPGPFDFVFIDADKPAYPDYYEAVLPKLSERGVIAADNTLRSGRVVDVDEDTDEGTRAIAEFNERVAGDERVVAVMLTVRDGVTLIRRR